MTAWIQINSDNKHTSISNRILWNNENILSQSKSVFQKLWYEKGIKHIRDIYGYRTKTNNQFED